MVRAHPAAGLLRRLRIKHQIYWVFCLAIIFPVLLLGVFSIRQTLELLNERINRQLESDNARAKSVLFDATLNFYNISDDLISDSRLKGILQEDYDSPRQARLARDSYGRLTKTRFNNASISSICVYSDNRQFPGTGWIRWDDTQQVADWFEAVKIPGSIHWESSVSPQSGTGDPELTMVRSFPFTDRERDAILVIRLSNNHLKNRIQNNDLFLSVSLDQDPIFFCTDRSLQGGGETAPIDYDRPVFQRSGSLSYQGRPAFSYISGMAPYNHRESHLYFTSMDFGAPAYLRRFLLLNVTVLTIAILVPCLVILCFANDLTRRITHLKNAMHDVSLGRFDPIEPYKGDDELSEIFVALKATVANVQRQQRTVYRARLKAQALTNRQQKMELKLLVSQINPHFIYNTLETIRMMALCEGAKDVAGAAALFGKTMRYVLENSGTAQTTLDRELDYVGNYLAIQKLRFDDKVNYAIRVPPGFRTDRYQILPLLLQPIVENAITHGIKESPRPGMIRICLEPREDQNRLVIRVTDNGVGIPRSDMEKLRGHMLGKHGEMPAANIGLFNIYQRIRLFYGPEFSFTLESQPGNGTCATLTLPLQPL